MCCGDDNSEAPEDVPTDGKIESGSTIHDSVLQDEASSSSGTGPFPGVIGRRRRIRRLFCRTGFDVAVYPNGKVRGTKNPRNKYALLEMELAGMNGYLRIKGTETGFYITMTRKGKVIGQPFADDLSTIWIETRLPNSTAYMSFLSLSQGHKGWYLAIKKSGKPKRGGKTTHPYPQKALSFLSRVVAEEYY